MNPNYVLSEDERRRRFKKRNNSLNEDKKTNVVLVIRSGNVVGNVETMKMPDCNDKHKTENCKHVLENQNQSHANDASHAISSQDTTMKHYKRPSLQNEINVNHNIPVRMIL